MYEAKTLCMSLDVHSFVEVVNYITRHSNQPPW